MSGVDLSFALHVSSVLILWMASAFSRKSRNKFSIWYVKLNSLLILRIMINTQPDPHEPFQDNIHIHIHVLSKNVVGFGEERRRKDKSVIRYFSHFSKKIMGRTWLKKKNGKLLYSLEIFKSLYTFFNMSQKFYTFLKVSLIMMMMMMMVMRSKYS